MKDPHTRRIIIKNIKAKHNKVKLICSKPQYLKKHQK